MEALLPAAAHGVVAMCGAVTTDGDLRCHALLPLVEGGRVVFALPYAEAGTAHDLAGAGDEVVLVLADGRLAGPRWVPVAAAGRLRLVEDREGERFRGTLMDQELRKHPPARTLIDSVLLQREHWWYVPRLLLEFDPAHVWPVEPLDPEGGGVLVWRARGALQAATVVLEQGTAGWQAPHVVLRARPAGAGDAPVALCRHDFSVPDRERACTLTLQGPLDGRRLHVWDRRGESHLPAVPGLLSRMRRQRALERGCRRGLAAAR